MRLHDAFDFNAREYLDVPFATQGERTVTYGEAAKQVNRLANALVAAGLGNGDRAAILAKNSIEYLYLYYAASKAGVTLVPLNYRLAPPEWSYIINDSNASLLLAAGEFTAGIDSVRGELSGISRYIVMDGAEASGWERYDAFISGQPDTPPDREVEETEAVYQMYTSGTTGRPKGAMLSHRAVTRNLQQLGTAFNPSFKEIRPGMRSLIVVPMYHVAAAVTCFNTISLAGCAYIQADFNPFEVVRVLDEEEVAFALLVPAMIQACLMMVPNVAERSYEKLGLMVYGASAIAEQTLRRAMDVFKCDFAQVYGMTETTAGLTFLSPADHRRALSEQPGLLVSAGRPLAGTMLRIVDSDDRPLPAGQVGEIIVRGPQLMTGYWNLAEATSEALRNGWMHTGDAGIVDENGYVYIQDRVKDMIVSGGENIYPREVEEVLFQHPAIADAAVIGVPDPQFGEGVKAMVVLKEGAQASAEEIMEFCRGRLAGYKRPRSVDFVQGLPRNPSGKVVKRELREPFWAGHTRRVGG